MDRRYAAGAGTQCREGEKMKCEECKFWKPEPFEPKKGGCRIDPPRAFMVPGKMGINIMSAWPSTQSDQWCGRFEKKVVLE